MKNLRHTATGVINNEAEDTVTTEQFVNMVFSSIKSEIESVRDDGSSGYIDYAMHKGIIEDYDRTNLSNSIERRSAARIVHDTLLTELSEKDEEDWTAAEKLLDLYSCRTCVKHIAQVYVKGIMLARANNIFDVKGNLTVSEAEAIVERMHDKAKRVPQTKGKVNKSKVIQPEEARELMLNNNRSMLIDVRTAEEYKQGHIDGSICMPLHDITINPFSVSIRKDTPIILYCQKGYKSSLAAQALIAAGYSSVYTIPGIEQHQYNLTK